jgi:trichohyalin
MKWRDGFMWKKKETKKEEKEEGLLKQLCGDDAKLYEVLGSCLYENPIEAISKQDLEILIEEAEKSVKDEDYREARQKYMLAMDKAIFEATQNPGERSRYIRVIQDLALKTVKVTEKVKEIVEKEGPADYASSARSRFEGSIRKCEFLSERIEDVTKVASLYYNEKLEELGAGGRREARRQERRDADSKEEMEDRKAREKREARGEERKEMGRGERREAEIGDKEEEKKEMERRKARGEERKEAEREEKRMEEEEKGRREAKRKEMRETRKT